MILALHPAGLTKSLVSSKQKGGREEGLEKVREKTGRQGSMWYWCGCEAAVSALDEKNMVYAEDRRHIFPQALPPMGQNSYVPRAFGAWGQAAGGKVRLIGALAGLSLRTREGSCCPDPHLSVHSVEGLQPSSPWKAELPSWPV